jgi:hypothetical protein
MVSASGGHPRWMNPEADTMNGSLQLAWEVAGSEVIGLLLL